MAGLHEAHPVSSKGISGEIRKAVPRVAKRLMRQTKMMLLLLLPDTFQGPWPPLISRVPKWVKKPSRYPAVSNLSSSARFQLLVDEASQGSPSPKKKTTKVCQVPTKPFLHGHEAAFSHGAQTFESVGIMCGWRCKVNSSRSPAILQDFSIQLLGLL